MKSNRTTLQVLFAAALLFAGAARAEDQQTITVRVPRFRQQQHFKYQLSPPGTKIIADFSKGDTVFEEFTFKVGPNTIAGRPGGVVIVDGSAVIVPRHFCGFRSVICGYPDCGGYYGGYRNYGYGGPYLPHYAFGTVYVQSTFAQPGEVGLFLGSVPIGNP